VPVEDSADDDETAPENQPGKPEQQPLQKETPVVLEAAESSTESQN
jgi:hypothetical protein